MISANEPILSFDGVTKRFGGTLAVDDVSLDLFSGEILALLGENGAGKSTLIKMLAGVHVPDGGAIRVQGAALSGAPKGSVSFIHQDLGLIEWMTVAENIALAQGYPRGAGLIDWKTVEERARRSLAMVAPDIDPNERVQSLTRTDKSLVAIARALGIDANVLVLDEPTASLPEDEVKILFKALRGLKSSGVAMIYVSHRLDEIYDISDRLAVLRDGKLVGVRDTGETEPGELIRMIIGRPPESVFVRPPKPDVAPLLAADGVELAEVGPLDFEIHKGEIAALVGLRGAGQEDVGRALFGLLPIEAGKFELNGTPLDIGAPPEAIESGICYVAGDRTADSIAHSLTVRENMFMNPQALGRRLFGWRKPEDEVAETVTLGADVGLVPNDPLAPIETLSGGNQQKVVIARWLRIGGSVLVLEDPTAGVDVGAKAEIYRLLAEAVAEGKAVVLISTDFEEVAAICHRAFVFRAGRIAAEMDETALSVESLVHAASLASTETTAA